MSDQSPPPDPLELLKRMWAPMALPVPGMVVPLANAADVEKRIADLRSVEHWLTLNLNVVKMSIQGLEMQQATLAALQAAQESLGRGAGPAGEAGAAANPLEAWWSLLQPQPQPQPPADAQPPQTRPPPGPRTRDPARRSDDGGKKGR